MATKIEEEDLLWHIKATGRELREYYPECANAITRIGFIETAVEKLLDEVKLRRDLPENFND